MCFSWKTAAKGGAECLLQLGDRRDEGRGRGRCDRGGGGLTGAECIVGTASAATEKRDRLS